MMKDETWSVSLQRARTFFREQSDMEEENSNTFVFNSCCITLTELKPKGMGMGCQAHQGAYGWRRH